MKMKGGEARCCAFEYENKNIVQQMEAAKILRPAKNPASQKVTYLIRAAALAQIEGEVRQIDADPTDEEKLGIAINKVRRKKKITLEFLSKNTGYGIEEIIAFEAGLLPNIKVCKMLPDVLHAIGVDLECIHKPLFSPDRR